jgi:TetR/AcrR family transcriptional regulator
MEKKNRTGFPEKETGVGATEQKILSAARLEFSERGFDGARMQAIADHAGVNKALLHYYFRSKEKLFEVTLHDIILKLWADIQAQMNKHQEETDLRALITTVVSVYINTFAAQPMIPKMIVREVAVQSPVIFRVIGDAISAIDIAPATILSIYNRELARGSIRPINPLHFMMNLMGMCAAAFIVKPIVEYISGKAGKPIAFDRKFYHKRIEAITEMACDGIFID